MLMGMQLWQFQRKIHASWQIAVASVAVVVGVAYAPTVGHDEYGGTVWLAVGAGLVAISLWRKSSYLMPLLIVGGLLIGIWRGATVQADLAVHQNVIDHTVTLSGTVRDDPDAGKKNETLLRLGALVVDGHGVAGTAWVSMSAAADVKRGDIVTVQGTATPGFGSFSLSVYRAQLRKVERPEPGDVARQARDWFADKVRVAIDDPEASLGLGYLVGQRRALPPELDEALVVAGLTHIVVASGYNLTILVRLARRLFVGVSKYLATLSAATMIAMFVAVTGASPSMTRAGLVAGLSLAAWYYGRRFHPLVLLPFAAAITVLVNPSFAWNDLGWQLSFTAFAGVMILAPLLQRYFFGEKKPGTIRQIVGETVSASILTLPILVLAFGQFSNVALFANLLVLPLVPLAMLLTFLAGIGAVLTPFLSGIVGLPAELLLGYMVLVAEYFAGLPWAQSTLEISPWMAWAAYAVIAGMCVYLRRATKYDLKDVNIVE